MTTSWQNSKQWYNESVGEQGHYYHRTLIIPNLLKWMNIPQRENISVLDIACGQGILSRTLPKNVHYYGYDLAQGLIQAAKSYTQNPLHHFDVADVTRPLKLHKTDFDYAVIMLAIQNIEEPLKVFQHVSKHLGRQGRLFIIMNHPYYRIPRQSSWGIDKENKIQFRRVDSYMSDRKIPIQTHPGRGSRSQNTFSFHYPLSKYTSWLKEAGFVLVEMQEWCSNKVSEGSAAKMENRSRNEIPLFMALQAQLFYS